MTIVEIKCLCFLTNYVQYSFYVIKKTYRDRFFSSILSTSLHIRHCNFVDNVVEYSFLF